MSIITRTEVKAYLRLADTLVEQEKITLPATTAGRRLSNKYVNVIHALTGSTPSSASTHAGTDYHIKTDFADYTLVSNISTGGMSTGGTYYVSYDYSGDNDDIDTLIPLVEADVCEYLNNHFEDRIVYIETGSGLAFVKGAPDTITDDNADFSTAGFVADMDVAIEGGSNHGIHTLAVVAAGTLTLDSTNKLINQDQDAAFNEVGSIKISRIDWPESIKPYIAQMIWYRLNKARPDSVKSESIDDYSVTYINGTAYPVETLRGLAKFKKAVLV